MGQGPDIFTKSMLLLMAGDIHLNPGPGITSAKVKTVLRLHAHVLSALLMLEKMTKEFCVTYISMTASHMLAKCCNISASEYDHNLIVKFGCALTHCVPSSSAADESSSYLLINPPLHSYSCPYILHCISLLVFDRIKQTTTLSDSE